MNVLKHFYTLVTTAVYLSIYCTQLVPLTRSNTIVRNVASQLVAGLVAVEQARTPRHLRGIELRGNALRVIVTQPYRASMLTLL